MRSILVSVLTLSLITLSTSEPKQPRADIEVGIYYSVWDAASIAYITAQGQGSATGIWDLLVPTPQGVVVNFVPYGLTTLNAGTYTCPDSDTNCIATRLQACAINITETDQRENYQVFMYMQCLTAHSSWKTAPTDAVEECAAHTGWPDFGNNIIECELNHREESDYVLEEMHQRTIPVGNPLTKVPVVTIGGTVNDAAATNLRTAVCGTFTGSNDQKPALCQDGATPSQPGSTQASVTGSTSDPGNASEMISSKFISFIFVLIAIMSIL